MKENYTIMDYKALPSKILHPLIVLPLAGIFVLFYNGLNLVESIGWVSLWIMSAMIPTALVAWRTGDKGFDIISRKQRNKSYIVGVTSLALSLVLSSLMYAPTAVTELGYFALGAVIIFGLANKFTKVSVHTGSIAFVAGGFLTKTLAIGMLSIILTVPVGWSRVKLDRHSRNQVIHGAILGFTCGLVATLL